MFCSPFPDFISFYCDHLCSSPDFLLLDEEEKISASFGSSKRRTEFSFGRYCARRAMSKFKLESVPILRNTESREPCWPESVRGSITHSEGFAAAEGGRRNEQGVKTRNGARCGKIQALPECPRPDAAPQPRLH